MDAKDKRGDEEKQEEEDIALLLWRGDPPIYAKIVSISRQKGFGVIDIK